MSVLEDVREAAGFGLDPLDISGRRSELGDPLDLFGIEAAEDAAAAATSAENAQLQALREAMAEQRRASEQGLGFLEPFAQLGQRGIDLSNFLVDPQARFDFLQSDPLFQMSLDQLNRGTAAGAASRGRLSAGDTLADLQQNALRASQPLIAQQGQGIRDLLNIGTGIATSQANTALGAGSNVANLLTDIGNVQAAGIGARQQAQSGIGQNIGPIAGLIASFFSDSRLKENIEKVGSESGYDVYRWDWNDEAFDKFNLSGSAQGVMSADVREKNPEAISNVNGYDVIDYDAIGVTPRYN